MKNNIFILLLTSCFISATDWYAETLHSDWGQRFKIDKVLFEDKTDHQHLIIFHNKQFGNVMALDGIIQTTQADEYVYHEMIAHVPLVAHGNAKHVLIIGGGDGGALREVLRHRTIQKTVMVDIDSAVIQMSKKYFPGHSQGAFDNDRAEIVIADGCKFVKECAQKFDIIIIDSTDPIGPGEKLFTAEFYADCHNLLNENGILVCQDGVPFLQANELCETKQNLAHSFKYVDFYTGVVPTYAGGFMTFGWATDNPEYKNISVETITNRMENITGSMRYYTPELHHASFALPQFIKTILENNA